MWKRTTADGTSTWPPYSLRTTPLNTRQLDSSRHTSTTGESWPAPTSPNEDDSRQPMLPSKFTADYRRPTNSFELMALNFQRQEQHYNLRRREWRPKLGDWVWKPKHPLSNKAQAFNAKLAPRYIGPLEMRRIILPVIVDLRDQKRRWYRQIHVRDLKKGNPTRAEDNEAKTQKT